MRVGRTALAVLLTLQSGALSVAQSELEIRDAVGLDADFGRFRKIVRIDAATPSGERALRNDLPIPGEELEAILEWWKARQGDGSGADIVSGSLTAIQTNFAGDSNCPIDCDGMTDGVQACNIILLIWEEGTFNPNGVEVYVDDVLFQTVPGLLDGDDPANADVPDADKTPGENLLFIPPPGVPAGEHTFRVQDPSTGSSDEVTMTVLDDQPFGDVANVQCALGPILEDTTCPILLGRANCGPLPDENNLLVTNSELTNAFLGTAGNDGDGDGDVDEDDFVLQTAVVVTGVEDDTYAFTLFGLSSESLENPRAQYRGCFIEGTECTVVCEARDCEPPFQPWGAQISYGPELGGIMTLWFLGLDQSLAGVPYDEGIHIYDLGERLTVDVDGNPAPIPGDIVGVVVNGPNGDHRLGIQGVCSGGVSSEITEKPFTLLEESPHPNPVANGEISLTYTPDPKGPGLGSTTATWTNADRSSFVTVYRIADPDDIPDGFPGGFPDDIIGGTLPGTESTYTLDGTAETDHLMFQFFVYLPVFLEGAYAGDQAFGSAPILGEFDTAQAVFLRGDGNDDGVINIADAQFLLNFLFLGGPKPPCEDGADSNDDGQANIPDAQYLLNHLFLGGPSPPAPFPEPGTDPTEDLLDPCP